MAHMVFPWLAPDDPASFSSLKSHANQITGASPTWCAMTAEGEHHVYYDDAATLHTKIQLVNEKGIQGLAFWRLGQESEGCWGAVTSVLA